jgi:flagellar biosynthesis/type III secretory pathway protein FliH
MQLISGFIDTYLRLNLEEEAIFQSELGTMETQEQEQIMQITTSWKEEGRVEGRLEGQKEGQSNTILRQLNRKLGNLPEEIATRIKSLEPEQLDTLTEDLLDFPTFEDLNRWLSNF